MTDTPSIPPALTATEWPGVMVTKSGVSIPFDFGCPLGAHEINGGHHKVAALALYGQPFGFTQEECEAIYTLCTPMAGGREGLELLRVAELALSAAAKIRSLLPPK